MHINVYSVGINTDIVWAIMRKAIHLGVNIENTICAMQQMWYNSIVAAYKNNATRPEPKGYQFFPRGKRCVLHTGR